MYRTYSVFAYRLKRLHFILHHALKTHVGEHLYTQNLPPLAHLLSTGFCIVPWPRRGLPTYTLPFVFAKHLFIYIKSTN